MPSTKTPEGQRIWFLILHNIISGVLLFSIGFCLGFYDKYYTSIWSWFSIDFILHVFYIFIVSMLLSILARYLAYVLYKTLILYRIRKVDGKYKLIRRTRQIKDFWDLSSGINSFMSFTFVLVNFLSAFTLAIGLFIIIYNSFFSALGILGLLLVYITLKIILYLFAKRWSGKIT